MIYQGLADGIVLFHIGFVLFAVFGGLLVLKWRHLVWLHVSAALWAVTVELAHWPCPLTPLENWLREQAGERSYETGFVENYILPILYPAQITAPQQIMLGALVLGINVAVYAWLWRRISGA
jgi:Protein of Unknown function (DUF2784)